MSREDRERKNPLNASLLLLDLADGPLTDQLEIVLSYIDGLPAELKASMMEGLSPETIDDLRLIVSGLKKLREDILPSEQELGMICHPEVVFDELPTALLGAVESTRTTLEQEWFFEKSIVKPLIEISKAFLPGPARGLVVWWFERLQDDPEGPFSQPSPGGP